MTKSDIAIAVRKVLESFCLPKSSIQKIHTDMGANPMVAGKKVKYPVGYYIEWNGDTWQSVFPESEAHKSQLHNDPYDALEYMREEMGVDQPITVLPRD